MKYYILTNSINTQEIGIYPQDNGVTTIGSLSSFYNGSSLGAFGKIEEFPVLPEPNLASRAKSTTFINNPAISSRFLIVKDYFIDFLRDFNFGAYQTWKLKVHHKGKIIKDYSLFHLSNPSQERYVDFKESSFCVSSFNNLRRNGEDVIVNNYKDFLNARTELSENGKMETLKAKEIVLNFKNSNEDLIRTVYMPIGKYIISERLKNAIEEKKYTGMTFQSLDNYNNIIKVIS